MVGGQQSQLWGFVHFWVPQVTMGFNTKNGLKALDLGYPYFRKPSVGYKMYKKNFSEWKVKWLASLGR